MDWLNYLSFSDGGWGDELLSGLGVTLSLAVATLPVGLLLGLLVAAITIFGRPVPRAMAVTFTTTIRGLPELLTLFIIYHGVGLGINSLLKWYSPQSGYFELSPFLAGVLALPRLQQAMAACKTPKVLIVRGEGGRELLAERLRGQGAEVDYLSLYRRVLPVYPPATLIQRVRAERLNALVVSSGQGFVHLRELAGEAWGELAQLPLFVPSPRVAELARAAGAHSVVDCRGASAAALLAVLQAQPAADL